MNKVLSGLAFALATSTAIAATSPKPAASAPKSNTIPLPEQAGGYCKDFYGVHHADFAVVIYTYYCNGQPYSIIAPIDANPKAPSNPIWPAPTRPAMLATELKRLDTLQGYSTKVTTVHQRLAEEQLKMYQPSPDELKKRSMTHKNII